MCVPHKPRNKKKLLWKGKKVIEKRGVLQDVVKGTKEEVRPKVSNVEDVKKDLDRAHTEEQEECVKDKTQETERAHESYKNEFSLVHSVNKISGRKGSFRGRIRASCPKEHIKVQQDHSEGLLGQSPVVDDQPITRVFDALPIKTGDFIMAELREAIKSSQGYRRLDTMVFQQRQGSLNVSRSIT